MMDGDGGFDGSYGRRSTRRERKLSLPQSDIDVDLMLEAYPVSPGGRDELDAALIDIYIKAARRLVVTADILPNELRRRSSEIRAGNGANGTTAGGDGFARDIELECSVADEDLYIVFPLHVIGEMYERQELAQHVDEAYPEGLAASASGSLLLPIFHYGSSALSAHAIAREDLTEAEHFVKLLYAEVLYLYEKRIAAVQVGKVRPESMGLAARIQHMIAREKARYVVLSGLLTIIDLVDYSTPRS